MAKLKDYLIERSETSREARERRLTIRAIVEYHIEHLTLREALGLLEDNMYRELDNMPLDVLQSEYNKIFNR